MQWINLDKSNYKEIQSKHEKETNKKVMWWLREGILYTRKNQAIEDVVFLSLLFVEGIPVTSISRILFLFSILRISFLCFL